MAIVSSMVLEVILITVGMSWLGKEVDERYNTYPLGIICSLFLGLLFGFLGAYYTMKSLTRE